MNTKKRLILIMLITLFLPAVVLAQTYKIDGYKNFKFGMTLEQAKKINPNLKLEEEDWDKLSNLTEQQKAKARQNFTYTCPTNISGHDAELALIFDRKLERLTRVAIRFIQAMGDERTMDCRKLAESIGGLIFKKYGTQYYDETSDFPNFIWRFPGGGTITLATFCFGKTPESKGIVLVAYDPSDTL